MIYQENFKKSFDEYEAGFTSTGDSYWVGLSSLHTITNTGNYRLRLALAEFVLLVF